MADKNETVEEAISSERDHIERAKADAEDLEIECEFTDEEVVCIIDRIEAAHRREIAQHDKKKRNCDGDRTDWRWYWGRYVTTQVCPCERKTATPEKHLRYFLEWLFLPKLVTRND